MGEDTSSLTMSYEKLFETLRQEKNHPALQKLPPTFFSDVSLYIHQQVQLVNQADASPFAAKEREQAAKRLANARKMLRMIYDLREKKILNLAVNKSRTASSIIDTGGLHEQETMLFRSVVDILDATRSSLLEGLLEGVLPSKKKGKSSGLILVRFLDTIDQQTIDGISYGPFSEEEIGNIPSVLAQQLIDKNKAQRIDPA